MSERDNTQKKRISLTAEIDQQPLLRVLLWEASQRGDSLMKLAHHLGVTYVRLAQWRRNEGLISNARREVHENAARYLGWPTVQVLTMAGTVALQDFVWPGRGSLDFRVARELERLRRDPFLGAFVPAELDVAHAAVKLFVIFLAHELVGTVGQEKHAYHWLRAMQLAAAGHADAQTELEKLRRAVAQEPRVF